MVNKQILINKMQGVIGFRPSDNPDLPTLNASNLESRSGYFVNNHNTVNLSWLDSTMTYAEHNETQFNDYLTRLQTESITSVCNSVFKRFDYLDRNLLYRYAMNFKNNVTLPSGFVGEKIKVSDEKNIAFKITRVLLTFSGTGDIDLMLFNTGQQEPIESKTITINSTSQEEVLNWVVDNSGKTYKGEYYLGYNTNGLTVEPFARDYENSSIESCYTYLHTESVKVPNHNTAQLFDLTLEEGFSEYNGINPDITVYEDYTDLAVQNEHLFSYAIYLDCVIRCLNSFIYSDRTNRDERLSDDVVRRMLIEVNGQGGEGFAEIEGLKPRLNSELEQISSELEKLKKGYFGDTLQVLTL
jgi:hypothetical protein